MALSISQGLTLKDAQGVVAVDDLFFIGTTATARQIYKTNLDVDYTITRIVIEVTALYGATPSNPLVIRVFQDTNETGFIGTNITGTGTFAQDVTLDITQALGANRTLIIDAFDPDVGSPNNTCQMKASVTIYGNPKVSLVGGGTI